MEGHNQSLVHASSFTLITGSSFSSFSVQSFLLVVHGSSLTVHAKRHQLVQPLPLPLGREGS